MREDVQKHGVVKQAAASVAQRVNQGQQLPTAVGSLAAVSLASHSRCGLFSSSSSGSSCQLTECLD